MLLLQHGTDFSVFVEYHRATLDITLRPADVFAENMEPGTGGFTLNHESSQFRGFNERRVHTADTDNKYSVLSKKIKEYYILVSTMNEIDSAGGLQKLVDAVMAIGISKVKTAQSLEEPVEAPSSNVCPHCGAEMGEGGMPGRPCIQCERLGRV